MKLFKSGHWILSVFPTYFVVQMKDCALATGLWQHRIVKHIHRLEVSLGARSTYEISKHCVLELEMSLRPLGGQQ